MGFGEFKKAFFAGELIWLVGIDETGDHELLRHLERLQVRPSCVEFRDSDDFLPRVSAIRGTAPEVLVVRLKSRSSVAQKDSCRRVLEQMIQIQKEQGFRVVLTSSECDPEWERLLERLCPHKLPFELSESRPVLDRTVHGLIEMASLHAEVKVSRLTEKAAFFLEESVKARVDGELVALVILGLKRSDGRVLRFKDLLPHFHRHFEGGDQGETV